MREAAAGFHAHGRLSVRDKRPVEMRNSELELLGRLARVGAAEFIDGLGTSGRQVRVAGV